MKRVLSDAILAHYYKYEFDRETCLWLAIKHGLNNAADEMTANLNIGLCKQENIHEIAAVIKRWREEEEQVKARL